MNKFKIGDRVKTNSEMDVLKYGIISIKDYHIIGDSLYLTYGLKYHESVEFNERDLELVETSEEIAVKKFKEEFRQILQKRLLEHKSSKVYWYNYLKQNSSTIDKFDGESIVSDLNKIDNYIKELERVLFLFEKNNCKDKLDRADMELLESEDK